MNLLLKLLPVRVPHLCCVGLLCSGSLFAQEQAAPATSSTVPAAVEPAVPFSAGVEEILKLVRSGVGQQTTLAFIENSPIGYKLSADEIIRLHRVGVPSEVTAAMILHGSQMRARMVELLQANQDDSGQPAPRNPWQPVQPETAYSMAPTYASPPVVYSASQYAYPEASYASYPSYGYGYPIFSWGVYPSVAFGWSYYSGDGNGNGHHNYHNGYHGNGNGYHGNGNGNGGHGGYGPPPGGGGGGHGGGGGYSGGGGRGGGGSPGGGGGGRGGGGGGGGGGRGGR